MATNLGIDPLLLEKALGLGGLSSKKATVNLALEEFIRRREQREIVKLFGAIDFDPAYGYKTARRKKPERS